MNKELTTQDKIWITIRSIGIGICLGIIDESFTTGFIAMMVAWNWNILLGITKSK